MEIVDYIIVGAGCTGAMAAETLCSSGKRVLMLDAGITANNSTLSTPDFIQQRFNEENQSDFLLGKKLEALSENTHINIPQQTAQRFFMSKLTDSLLPVVSDNFFPVESLAFGGLGNGWGLGSYLFSEKELQLVGLEAKDMLQAYKTVAERIGISGVQQDDASIYCHAGAIVLQPATALNSQANSLYKQYQKRRQKFLSKHMYMGRPSLALLTQDSADRKGYAYKDIDFYSNDGNSAYRPNITLEKLIRNNKLLYQNNWLVLSFKEEINYTCVNCLNIQTKELKVFYAKKLILAASTLSTTRIVLRSLGKENKLPVLCNAYTYMPMVYWPFLGKRNIDQFSGLAQLAMFYDKNNHHEHVAMASIYNYRSLLNFRVLKQMPLNAADGNKFLQLLIPALFVAGIFHPAGYQSQNYVQLKQADTVAKDLLETNYTYTDNELQDIIYAEKQYAQAFAAVRCTVLKKMRTVTGASIHYAGTLPFSDTEKPFHLSPCGKLYGTNSVHVADGSGFKFLPGKGLTLSLMANAHLVAQKIIQDE